MIGVIGLGFVGLTTALGFAYKGFDVYGFDVDLVKVTLLEKREVPFHEPHLKDLLERTLNDKFIVCTNLQEMVDKCEVIFYCVGTPNTPQGEADLSSLFRVIEETLVMLRQNQTNAYKILVIKSTVPPGTTKSIIHLLLEKQGFTVGEDIGLANNPEFLREGYAWKDFIEPDRVVIGVEDKKSKELLTKLYQHFNAPVYTLAYNGAEFIKYLSNTLLASMISFSNEMSMIADRIGEIDIPLSFKILHQDKRWFGYPAPMSSYIYPGCGFGGYCLPKDLKAMYHQGLTYGYEANLLKSVALVNDKIKEFVVNKIISLNSNKDIIGILGLSFKPNSDDVRESASYDIIKTLLDKGYTIIAHDPLAIDNFKNEYKLPIEYRHDLETLIKSADCLVILTGWEEYKNYQKAYRGKKIIDFRYIL